MSNLDAFVNPVVRGVINPNKTITYKKELHFDSCFRDNYGAPNTSASSFLFNLPQEIDNVVSLRLVSINIPSIPSTISKSNGNNSFYIVSNDGARTYIEIDNGNYTLSELISLINDKISEKFATPVIKFTKLQSEEKTKITNTTETAIKIVFYETENCSNFMNTLGWQLGFRKASVTVTQDLDATSCGLFNNNFIDYLYFSADDFQRNVTNNNIVYLNQTTNNNNILGKIYRSSITGTYYLNDTITSNSYYADRSRTYFGPVRLSKFKFSLLDKFGNLVDLHNMDYSFTLEVEVLYDRNNVTIPC